VYLLVPEELEVQARLLLAEVRSGDRDEADPDSAESEETRGSN